MTGAPSVLLGGSGFVGSALARVLAHRGTAVRIADIRPSAALPQHWVSTDVRDPHAVARAIADAGTLFLLAAEHGLEPRPRLQFEEVNVGGAHAVVVAARRTGLRRIVFTSTVAVYGLPASTVTEDSPCRPQDDYGRTKLAAEQILRGWAAEDPSRSLSIIRPTVVFGPGVRGRMRSLFHQMALPDFTPVGEGENRKSFADVDNLAAFHAHLEHREPGTHLFNYADGPDLTMAELATLIRSALDLGPSRPARTRRAALVRAFAQQLIARVGGPAPEWTVSQVQRFCADSRFLAERVADTGFVAPLSLTDAVVRYARSDLRWAARRIAAGAPLTSSPAGDVPAA